MQMVAYENNGSDKKTIFVLIIISRVQLNNSELRANLQKLIRTKKY